MPMSGGDNQKLGKLIESHDVPVRVKEVGGPLGDRETFFVTCPGVERGRRQKKEPPKTSKHRE